MEYCSNCHNIFDISRDDKQAGGSLNDIINNIINDVPVTENDVKDIDLDKLKKSAQYKKLTRILKEKVYNTIQDLKPSELTVIQTDLVNQPYFICKNCGNRKPIQKGTMIFSKVSDSQNYIPSDTSNSLKYSDILPRTRKYQCPNKDCESRKNVDLQEASMRRIGTSYKTKYACLACGVEFII